MPRVRGWLKDVLHLEVPNATSCLATVDTINIALVEGETALDFLDEFAASTATKKNSAHS
jgi:hypothetical protein